MIFFIPRVPPLHHFTDFDKMQKNWIFLFFEIRTPFFDSILRTAPGTILNHCHQVRPPVLRRNLHFDARAFVSCCCSQAPQLKKVIFPKFFPYCNSARIFHFLYPQTSLILCYLINFLIGAGFEHPGQGFVFWENSANFSKIKNHFLERPLHVKKPKRFSFWYPQTSLILFYLIRFLVGASFQGSGSGFVFAEGAKIVKKSVPKSVKKARYG